MEKILHSARFICDFAVVRFCNTADILTAKKKIPFTATRWSEAVMPRPRHGTGLTEKY